jgi:CubicO group peptidase (beta-lactamase class C family)
MKTLGLLFISISAFAQLPKPSNAAPSLSAIQSQTDAVVSELTKAELWIGGVAAIQSGSNAKVSYYGTKSTGDASAPDQNSLFEIGSISKSFTGILAAEMILNHPGLSFDDPVSKFVPELLGTFAGSTTLRQLGVHTSGIPSIPCDEQANPTADYCYKNTDTYATYTEKRFLDFLEIYKPATSGPFPYQYSNAGVALLGYVVSRVENKSYDDLIRAEITGPLQMNQTEVERPAKTYPGLLRGYNIAKQEQANWAFDVMAPAGAIISSGPDMAKYLSANLNPPATILGQAILLSHQTGICWDSHDNKIGTNSNAIWKNGGTAGFGSILDFDPVQGIGVFASGNIFSNLNDFAGFQAISNQKIPISLGAVTLNSEALANFVGNFVYTGNPRTKISISIINGNLFLTSESDLLRLEPTLISSSSATFVSYDGEISETSVRFSLDANGKVSSLIVHFFDGASPDLAFTRLP